MGNVFVHDPTSTDKLSSVRGIGRYLQILKENFPEWTFSNNLTMKQFNNDSVFINPFFNFLRPPLTLKRLTHKQIAVIHDLIPLKYPDRFPAGIRGNLNIFLNKFSLKNYDLIVTDSEASKKDIINILNIQENGIRVIYPCLPKVFSASQKSEVKSQNLNPKLKSIELDLTTRYELPTTNYCLYVGDATWNKNLVNLAKAIKIINVTCVFVGNIFNNGTMKQSNDNGTLDHPWNRELKQFFKETTNDKRFIFAGFLPDKELIKLYTHSSLNILPSRDEGFGFSYLEAGNFSCPSVLSAIPVLEEISGGEALFSDPQNPNDIADKIGEIYFDPDKRNSLGRRTKERAGYFSSDKFREGFEEIIF